MRRMCMNLEQEITCICECVDRKKNIGRTYFRHKNNVKSLLYSGVSATKKKVMRLFSMRWDILYLLEYVLYWAIICKNSTVSSKNNRSELGYYNTKIGIN